MTSTSSASPTTSRSNSSIAPPVERRERMVGPEDRGVTAQTSQLLALDCTPRHQVSGQIGCGRGRRCHAERLQRWSHDVRNAVAIAPDERDSVGSAAHHNGVLGVVGGRDPGERRAWPRRRTPPFSATSAVRTSRRCGSPGSRGRGGPALGGDLLHHLGTWSAAARDDAGACSTRLGHRAIGQLAALDQRARASAPRRCPASGRCSPICTAVVVDSAWPNCIVRLGALVQLGRR